MKKTAKIIFIALFIILVSTIKSNAATMKGKEIMISETTCGYQKSYNDKVIVSKIKAGKKYEVLEVDAKRARFRIKVQNKYVWVKSEHVFVNVKEYIPSIDVHLYMADEDNRFSFGGSAIKGLTENQYYTKEGSMDGSECWLRYETAKKLLYAQRDFLNEGYSIVIYDAYRPNSVCKAIKEAFSSYLSTVPYNVKAERFGNLGEGWFIAQGPSSHSFGIAVDMSIRKYDKETKKKTNLLNMPSRLHTLDKSSAFDTWGYLNTNKANNAKKLREIMTRNGFADLRSEWWHFQDNETMNKVNQSDVSI